jgi:hypothetical protein
MFLRRSLLVAAVAPSFYQYPDKYIECYGRNFTQLSRHFIQPPVLRAEGSVKKDGISRQLPRDTPTSLYAPLDSSTSQPHIRLIELLPGSGSHPLIVNLNEVPLSDHLLYEAISYC